MFFFLFDDNKIEMARKPGKIYKEERHVEENPVGGTIEGKR